MVQDKQGGNRQRRVDVRVKINLKYPDRDTFVSRFSQNLSRTGIFIRASDPAPVGSRVHFEYRLADATRVLRGVGIVRWARRSTDASEPDAPPGMGIEFIDIDPQTEELLTEVVNRFGEGQRAPRSSRRPRPVPAATAVPPGASDFPAATQRLDPEEQTALDTLLGEPDAGPQPSILAADIDPFDLAAGDEPAPELASLGDAAPPAPSPQEAPVPDDGLVFAETKATEESDLIPAGPAASFAPREADVDVDADPDIDVDLDSHLDTNGASEPAPPLGASDEAPVLPEASDESLDLPEAIELAENEELAVVDADAVVDGERVVGEIELNEDEQVDLVDAELEPPPAPASAGPITATAASAASAAEPALVPDTVLLDWSGSAMLSARANADGTVGEPVFWVPRLTLARAAVTPAEDGSYLPGLLSWLGRRWPSPYVQAAARRLGLEVNPSAEGLVLRAGDTEALLADAIVATVEPMLAPLADQPTEGTVLLVPSNVTTAARHLLVDRLTVLGFAPVDMISDSIAVVRAAGVEVTGGLILHLDVSLSETRAAVVRTAEVVASAAAPDLGLWDADQVVADWAAIELMRQRGLDAEAEPSLLDNLLDQLSDQRRETPAGLPWNLDAAGVPLTLEPAALAQRLAAMSERVGLLGGTVLDAAGEAKLNAVILTTEEPAWPGLAETLAAQFAMRLITPEPGPAVRLRGAVAKR